jgi:hypothetical protein
MPEDFWRQTFSFTEAVTQLTISQNAFMEADILFTEAIRIIRLVK